MSFHGATHLPVLELCSSGTSFFGASAPGVPPIAYRHWGSDREGGVPAEAFGDDLTRQSAPQSPHYPALISPIWKNIEHSLIL